MIKDPEEEVAFWEKRVTEAEREVSLARSALRHWREQAAEEKKAKQ